MQCFATLGLRSVLLGRIRVPARGAESLVLAGRSRFRFGRRLNQFSLHVLPILFRPAHARGLLGSFD